MTEAPVVFTFWNLWLPALVGAGLAVALPILFARRLPESYGGLLVNFVACSALLLVCAMAFFAGSYAVAGAPLVGMVWAHLTDLSLKSAIFWAPITGAVLLQQPRHWRPDL